jgi:hypothetical protein
MEWHNEDIYNSFNSWKGLFYIPWYNEIKKWKEKKQELKWKKLFLKGKK